MNLCTEKHRSLSLDCIRIAAILAVIMIHTAMNFVSYDINSLAYMWGNIFDSLARVGVPLFIMVSGALMLDEEKDISVKRLFSKYILNIVLLFIVWSVIYMIPTTVNLILNGQAITFYYIVNEFLTGGFHMWYMIIIIGLYLIVPVLRLFVKKENSNIIAYIILVSLFFMFLPVLLKSLSEFDNVFLFLYKQLARFEYEFIGIFPTYFIMGWYVKHVGIKYKKTIYLSAIISVLAIILLVQFTGNYQDAYSNGNILVFLYSVGVFTFINDVCKNKTSGKIIEKLSNLTFGVYIIHIIVLWTTNIFFDNIEITLLSIMIRFCLITVISFTGSYIMSKIPGIRKLVKF